MWDDKNTSERKKPRNKVREAVEMQEEVEDLTSIHLGSKLQDLEKKLRSQLDTHPSTVQSPPHAPTMARREESMSVRTKAARW